MRSNYPVNKKENINELNELQEHLIFVLGADKHTHDTILDASGIYDVVDANLDITTSALISNRLGQTFASPSGEVASYVDLYSTVTRHDVARKIYGK